MIEAIFQGLGSADLTVAACLGTKRKRVTSPTQQRQHLQGTNSRTSTQTHHPEKERRENTEEIASNRLKDKGREKISR